MKRFELSIVRREKDDKDFTPRSVNKIEADTMVELLAQLTVLVAMIMRECHEYEIMMMKVNEHDDIPF